MASGSGAGRRADAGEAGLGGDAGAAILTGGGVAKVNGTLTERPCEETGARAGRGGGGGGGLGVDAPATILAGNQVAGKLTRVADGVIKEALVLAGAGVGSRLSRMAPPGRPRWKDRDWSHTA